MYVRLTKTVADRGVLLRPQDVEKNITDRESSWYVSPYIYPEDALEYWEQNGQSIKGYNGAAYTTTLYWDLDCKTDFNKARVAAIALYDYLNGLGLDGGVEFYFSGNKGFHVLLHTSDRFTKEEVSAICYNVAKETAIPNEVFDTSVYNITRIFRVENTRHQDSGLYKIQMHLHELEQLSDQEIRDLAKIPRIFKKAYKEVDPKVLKEMYKAKLSNVTNVATLQTASLQPSKEESNLITPPGERECIHSLEEGQFGAGERHSAIIRLAAYYKGREYSKDHATILIKEALIKRALRNPDVSEADPKENERDINQVYNPAWKGGTFTCKTDPFLQSKCDHGEGPCSSRISTRVRRIINVDQLFNFYTKHGDEGLVEYPKFGLPMIDDNIRLRPRSVSLINGAAGSGKTSLVINLLENLNKQKLWNILFSLDMDETSLFEKLGAAYTNYTQKEIEQAFNPFNRNEDIMMEVKARLKEVFPYTLFDFTSSTSIKYIEDTIITLKQSGIDIQLAVIDYAGRLTGEHDNQFANATANALGTNDVAKRANVHLMILSQVSRENGDHTDPLRTSRVSKDSGAWEENATLVINVWRPFGDGLNGSDKYIVLYIGKNRSGKLGEIPFFWNGKEGKITQMTRRDFEEYRQSCESSELEVPYDPFATGDYDFNNVEVKIPKPLKLNEKLSGNNSVNNQKVPSNRPPKFGTIKRTN